MSVRESIRAQVRRGLPDVEEYSGEPAVVVEQEWAVKEGPIRLRDLLRPQVRGVALMTLLFLGGTVWAAVDAVQRMSVGAGGIAVFFAWMALTGLRDLDGILSEENPDLRYRNLDDRYRTEDSR